MDEMEISKLWLELKVDYILIDFSCGSDSTDLEGTMIYDQSGTRISSYDLSKYFEDEIFNNVDFDEATDDYYLGESGTVKITMVEDGGCYWEDNEEGEEIEILTYEFIYDKKSKSKYAKEILSTLNIPLDDTMIKLIKEKISNINGNSSIIFINKKTNVDLTEEEDIVLENLKSMIVKYCKKFIPQIEGEIDDYYQYDTVKIDRDETEKLNNPLIQISNNCLVVIMKNYCKYEE